MINWKNMFSSEFVEWNDYKNKIDMLDEFWWRQSVRAQSLKNS